MATSIAKHQSLELQAYCANLSLRKVQVQTKPDFLTWINHIKPGIMDKLRTNNTININQLKLK